MKLLTMSLFLLLGAASSFASNSSGNLSDCDGQSFSYLDTPSSYIPATQGEIFYFFEGEKTLARNDKDAPEPVNKKYKPRLSASLRTLQETKEKDNRQARNLKNSGTIDSTLGEKRDVGCFNGMPKPFVLEMMSKLDLSSLLSLRLTCKTFATLSQADALTDVYCMTIYDLHPSVPAKGIPMGPNKISVGFNTFINKTGDFLHFHPAALRYTLKHQGRVLTQLNMFSLTKTLKFYTGLTTFIFDVPTWDLFKKKEAELQEVLHFRTHITTLVLPQLEEIKLLRFQDGSVDSLIKKFVNIKRLILKDASVDRTL